MILQAPYPYSIDLLKGVFRILDYACAPLGFHKLTDVEIELESHKIMNWFSFTLLPFEGAITYAAFTGTPAV